MKKTISMIAVLLLALVLVAVPVLAAAISGDVPVKDAPEVETFEATENKEAVAVLHDKVYNELGSLTADDVVVTPYSKRADAKAETKEELEWAYKDLESDPMDVTAPDVVTDLKERMLRIQANDLTVTDLFHVELTEDTKKVLEAQGSTITMDFDLDVSKDEFFLVMHLLDEEWKVIPEDRVEILDNGFTSITFEQDIATVAVLKLPGASSDFVPSPSQSGAPAVETETDNTLIRIIPYFDREQEETPIKTEMETAYNQIIKAVDKGETLPEIEEGLKALETELTAADLVVRDLFYIDLDEETKTAMTSSEIPITLAFDMEMKMGDFVMVLRFDDGKWTVISDEMVRISRAGDVIVDFPEDIGTVAFVVKKS